MLEEKSLDFEITIFLREHNEKFPHVIWIILTGCDISAGNSSEGTVDGLYFEGNCFISIDFIENRIMANTFYNCFILVFVYRR